MKTIAVKKISTMEGKIRTVLVQASNGDTTGLYDVLADLSRLPAAEVIRLVSAVQPAWRCGNKREALVALVNHCESLAERNERIPVSH